MAPALVPAASRLIGTLGGRTRTEERPDESGRGRLRVCATLSYTTIFGLMTATPIAFM